MKSERYVYTKIKLILKLTTHKIQTKFEVADETATRKNLGENERL